jgi:hypothetical protein
MIFKKNWYHRLNEYNFFIWKQFQHQISSQIEFYYKKDFLCQGNKENIKVLPDVTVNYEQNIQLLSEDSSRSIMRFSLKNSFPDKVTSIKVPQEIF